MQRGRMRTRSTWRKRGREPANVWTVANASSYARRIRKPPKTRPCMLRCCGWHVSVLLSRVLSISSASPAASPVCAGGGENPSRTPHACPGRLQRGTAWRLGRRSRGSLRRMAWQLSAVLLAMYFNSSAAPARLLSARVFTQRGLARSREDAPSPPKRVCRLVGPRGMHGVHAW